MKQLMILTLLIATFPAQAGIMDDIMAWFSGGDEQAEEAPAPAKQPVKEPAKAPTAEKPAAAQKTGTVTQLLPLLTGTLGVTERQARGGLGAIFQASKSVLTAQDFSLIERYVPEVNQLMSEAPPTNQLMGGALQMARVGAGGTAAANLATQFHDLGVLT